MKISNIPAAQLLVHLCRSAGIKDIVISPGSRNAPLILSFTGDTFFNCYSVVDERCAAFFALGIAQQIKRPVAVVCTSGSALLNYYPAVAEAYYSNIPLVVISADRPPYKIDVGDGQTIRQDGVFDRHIGASVNLSIDVAHAQERLSFYHPSHLNQSQENIDKQHRDMISRCFNTAFLKKLPVHINIPFEEPLYGLEEVKELSFSWEPAAEPILQDEVVTEELPTIWAKAKRKMVLVGVNPPDSISQAVLDSLANDPGVVVFTETTSNLAHPNFFPSIDSILFPIEKSGQPEKEFAQLQPEVLLTFGGLVVSKKIKAFLRKYKPAHHWHIDPHRAFDTFFSLSKHIRLGPDAFLQALTKNASPIETNYFKTWDTAKRNYEAQRARYMETAPFSDFTVLEFVQRNIPKNYQLQLSNSSTIRYTQLFPLHPSIKVYCNRGTSGIDGSTSTAVGSAVYANDPTLLITGDLSFFYDANALWNNYLRKDFRIIVLNNQGGGIFRILPGFNGSAQFATYFETQHQLTAKPLCEQFELTYYNANDKRTLATALENFFKPADKPQLLEIFTPTELNDRILLDYFDFISSENH